MLTFLRRHHRDSKALQLAARQVLHVTVQHLSLDRQGQGQAFQSFSKHSLGSTGRPVGTKTPSTCKARRCECLLLHGFKQCWCTNA